MMQNILIELSLILGGTTILGALMDAMMKWSAVRQTDSTLMTTVAHSSAASEATSPAPRNFSRVRSRSIGLTIIRRSDLKV